VRTLGNLPCSVWPEHDGRRHHALDDAERQAKAMAATLRRIEEATDAA
jgi:hypothetical protein